MFVLVTGGAGYIGSHTCVELIKAGFEPVIIDNLSNSKEVVLDRIETIAGKRPVFMQGDIRDSAFLNSVFEKYFCCGYSFCRSESGWRVCSKAFFVL